MQNLPEVPLFLRPEEIEAFGAEIHELYLQAKAEGGRKELQFLETSDTVSKTFDVLGRGLIFTGGPLSWLLGSYLLSLHYVIEFSQGHNIFHEQYDSIPGNTRFRSETWKWDNTMDEEDWKFAHQSLHHPFTNVLGVDPDFGYLMYRLNQKQEWKPHHLFQFPLLLTQPLISTFFFPWYVASSRAFAENRKPVSFETYSPSLKKIIEHFFKNYLLFPGFSGFNSLKVMTGNALAKLISNYYLQFIFGVSHLSEASYVFPEKEFETEAEYYLRQVLSTVNFEIPEFLELICGGMDTHLEHHLFPDLPPLRLKKLAPKVKGICEKYNIPYRKAPFLEQILSFFRNVLYCSFPIPEKGQAGLELLFQTKPEMLLRDIAEKTKSYLVSFFQKEDEQDEFFLRSKVLKKKIEIPGKVASFVLKVPSHWKGLSWEAGSYISVQMNIGNSVYTRQYSLLRPSSVTREFHIAVKEIEGGKVSGYMLRQLKEGDELYLLGRPRGKFTLGFIPPKLLFIAAGIGITSILSMLYKLKKESPKHKVSILYFNRYRANIAFYKELLELLIGTSFDITFYLTGEENIPKNVSTQIKFASGWISEEGLERAVPDYLERYIYASAPEAFIQKTKDFLEHKKFPLSRLYYATFSPNKGI